MTRRSVRYAPAAALLQRLETRLLFAADGVADSSAPAPAWVNAGGGTYVDTIGRTFEAGTGFTGGYTAQSAPYDVQNTADDPLFLTYWQGAEFAYGRGVPDGNYALFLEFAEPVFNAPAGFRTFDVWAEGQQVLSGFDVAATGGGPGRAVAKSFDVRVADGRLDLTFRGVVREAIVSAVVLVPTDVPPEAAAYAWPALSDAARRDLAARNLYAIGSTLYYGAIYGGFGGRDRYPLDLSAVYPTTPGPSNLSHIQFASPRTGSALPRGELSGVERVGWAASRRDFIYVGAGRRVDQVRPWEPLAYENPDRVSGDVAVVFGDIHVEFVDRAAAAQLIGFPPPPAEPADPPPPASPQPAPDPRVSQSAANLLQISSWIHSYSFDHRYRFPDSLGQAYNWAPASASVAAFANPRAGTVPPPDNWTTEQKIAWIESSTDYVYLGRGQRADLSDDYTLLAYENPATLTGGINVLFGTGRVEFREARWAAETLGLPQAAVVGGPFTVAAGGPLGLSATASPAVGRTLAAYEWDFDYDGSTFQVDATGANVTFTAGRPAGPSPRTVGVRVRDDLGKSSLVATAQVTIVDAPPAAPGVPDLAAGSDTGYSSTDNITRLDNRAGRPLQFVVPNTTPGTRVGVFADGALIGEAPAGSGTSTTVTTNVALMMANGVRLITARQTAPGHAASPASAALAVTIDTRAPTVVRGSQQYVFAADPNEVRFAFSEDVGPSLEAADLAVRPAGGGAPVPVATVSYAAGTNTATFAFAGRVPDGNYRATLLGDSIEDAAGNTVSISNQDPGELFLNFFVLHADLNRDRIVDTADLSQLLTNFGRNVNVGHAQGDLDANGIVDTADLSALLTNFGRQVLPPAVPDASASAAAPTAPAAPSPAVSPAVPVKPATSKPPAVVPVTTRPANRPPAGGAKPAVAAKPAAVLASPTRPIKPAVSGRPAPSAKSGTGAKPVLTAAAAAKKPVAARGPLLAGKVAAALPAPVPRGAAAPPARG